MAKTLTTTAVDAIRPSKAREEISDAKITGLKLIVQPSGSKSWAFRYSFAGQRRKLTIGSYPAIGVADARQKALEAASQVEKGVDPGATKAAAKHAVPNVDGLIETVADAFVELYAKPNLRSWQEVQRKLAQDVLPLWAGRRFEDITRADIHRLADSINARGSRVAANRTLAVVRRMGRWAVDRGIIATNPAEGVGRPTKEKPRDRILDETELALVWRAADMIGPTYGPPIKALILTGQRRDEIAAMRWSEVDSSARTLTLSAERTKNRRLHVVALSEPAMRVITSRPRRKGVNFVFGYGERPPENWSRAKEALDKAVAKLNDGEPIRPFVIHDIRRSVASGMARIGVPLHVIERILNHMSGTFGGIVSVYQHHSYADEARAALDQWAAEVERIVGQGGSANG
jgi:integrase